MTSIHIQPTTKSGYRKEGKSNFDRDSTFLDMMWMNGLFKSFILPLLFLSAASPLALTPSSGRAYTFDFSNDTLAAGLGGTLSCNVTFTNKQSVDPFPLKVSILRMDGTQSVLSYLPHQAEDGLSMELVVPRLQERVSISFDSFSPFKLGAVQYKGYGQIKHTKMWRDIFAQLPPRSLLGASLSLLDPDFPYCLLPGERSLQGISPLLFDGSGLRYLQTLPFNTLEGGDLFLFLKAGCSSSTVDCKLAGRDTITISTGRHTLGALSLSELPVKDGGWYEFRASLKVMSEIGSATQFVITQSGLHHVQGECSFIIGAIGSSAPPAATCSTDRDCYIQGDNFAICNYQKYSDRRSCTCSARNYGGSRCYRNADITSTSSMVRSDTFDETYLSPTASYSTPVKADSRLVTFNTALWDKAGPGAGMVANVNTVCSGDARVPADVPVDSAMVFQRAGRRAATTTSFDLRKGALLEVSLDTFNCDSKAHPSSALVIAFSPADSDDWVQLAAVSHPNKRQTLKATAHIPLLPFVLSSSNIRFRLYQTFPSDTADTLSAVDDRLAWALDDVRVTPAPLCGSEAEVFIVATDSLQYITDGGNPGSIASAANCRWTISPPTSTAAIVVNFERFQLPGKQHSCPAGRLLIAVGGEGDRENPANTVLSGCGDIADLPFRSFLAKDSSVYIQFVSKGTSEGGFIVSFRLAAASEMSKFGTGGFTNLLVVLGAISLLVLIVLCRTFRTCVSIAMNDDSYSDVESGRRSSRSRGPVVVEMVTTRPVLNGPKVTAPSPWICPLCLSRNAYTYCSMCGTYFESTSGEEGGKEGKEGKGSDEKIEVAPPHVAIEVKNEPVGLKKYFRRTVIGNGASPRANPSSAVHDWTVTASSRGSSELDEVQNIKSKQWGEYAARVERARDRMAQADRRGKAEDAAVFPSENIFGYSGDDARTLDGAIPGGDGSLSAPLNLFGASNATPPVTFNPIRGEAAMDLNVLDDSEIHALLPPAPAPSSLPHHGPVVSEGGSGSSSEAGHGVVVEGAEKVGPVRFGLGLGLGAEKVGPVRFEHPPRITVDPSGSALEDSDHIAIVRRNMHLSFADKAEWFNARLRDLRISFENGRREVVVRRESILEDSIRATAGWTDMEWRMEWRFVFNGEIGLDNGGLAKEWHRLMTEALCSPSTHILKLTPTYAYEMDSAAGTSLSSYTFLGKFIGKCILNRITIDLHLAEYIIKHMLQQPVTFEDLSVLDRELYTQLRSMVETDGAENLSLDFTVPSPTALSAVSSSVSLKEGGESIDVTDDNKLEFVHLRLQHRMIDSTGPQLDSFFDGLYSVVPSPYLAIFNERELDMMLCGLPRIDVDNWRRHTVYRGYVESDPIIQWFWQVVQAWTQEERSMFLLHVTGSSRPPVSGFANLLGTHSRIELFTIEACPATVGYPRVHSCFNRIDLPRYSSKEQVAVALNLLLQVEGDGFTIQ